MIEGSNADPEGDPLGFLHPAARAWFESSFDGPTEAQRAGWPPIVDKRSTLLLAPTGSGKTLAAFLSAINRLVFAPTPPPEQRCRVLYISPIKALGVDIERNLRAPLAEIGEWARREGHDPRAVQVAIRSGDTPQRERARMKRHPPDILITTPESLYLMLTSQVGRIFAGVETVIIDEIHSVVGTKRGTHLALSLERLEWLRTHDAPLQRIGLSATQRPLDEVARFLGGCTVGEGPDAAATPRPVTIVDAGRKKAIDLRIETPAEDAAAAEPDQPPAGAQRSAWPAIHPRLVQLIRAHRSTMIFTNSRRLSERLSAALNELAGEELALAHHGSLARDQRLHVEERLKQGLLPAIVATSSLELGIDMGAVDLVVQLEAPPSIASGMQRIGRASHHVGGRSRGIILPKYKGDLLACAAAARAMLDGVVESTRYPRNPLDVLAQQLVAAVGMRPWSVDGLFRAVRCAAPYADLPREAFEGVLDMLSGRYPSDDFADLRARITYDRINGRLEPRKSARRVAIINGGTIPDRGLYGVFLAGDDSGRSRRVGELDEEMVFESRPGDVFLLGATSWRIEQITHDKVLVTPAPGEPGRMPFWRGDGPGRPLEFGEAIGALTRRIGGLAPAAARSLLQRQHCLDATAAEALTAYVHRQKDAGSLPSDRTVVVERFLDAIGDWRICVMSPYGAPVHAPWAMAVRARLLDRYALELDAVWSDDGMVFRLPEGEQPPDLSLFLPPADGLEDAVVSRLAETSLFAARFRENAGRALLLTRRRPGQRTPLWALRRKSAELLAVATRYRNFPVVLETYRECLKDAFDLPGALELMRRIERRAVTVVEVESRSPSPFASAMLFDYVTNFMYEGDAPLAERRAQALTIDPARLRALLGDAALRELLDPDAIDEVEYAVQRRSRWLSHPDDIHDLLLTLGDLSRDAIIERFEEGMPADAIDAMLNGLVEVRRIVPVELSSGRARFIAAEDAGRYRDGLGVAPPPGLPAAFLEAVDDPLGDLVARHARTHGPFTVEWVARRFGVAHAPVVEALRRLAAREKVTEGEFLPGGAGREWCDSQVLRRIKRLSLARLRGAVEPVEPEALARFLVDWQGIGDERSGPEAILGAIEQLQGAPIPASVLESEVLPARVADFRPADLDLLCAAGEVVWQGVRPLGQADGYVALYLTDERALLAPDPEPVEGALAARIRDALAERGASFFDDIVAAVSGFQADVLEALWALVWAGEVGNDTLTALRSRLAGATRSSAAGRRRGRRAATRGRGYRSRRRGPPGSEGRWSLRAPAADGQTTERRAALAGQLLERYGVLTREAVGAEGIAGGFGAVYPVLKAMEQAGKLRRGYFTAGLGATQFALPGADDRLRDAREPDATEARAVTLAATDPANPYGAALPWPELDGARFERAAGARVVLHDGRLVGFLSRSGKMLHSHLPGAQPARGQATDALAAALAALVELPGVRAVHLEQIDGGRAGSSALAPALAAVGFKTTYDGVILRRGAQRQPPGKEAGT